jgi:hypothetical protein
MSCLRYTQNAAFRRGVPEPGASGVEKEVEGDGAEVVVRKGGQAVMRAEEPERWCSGSVDGSVAKGR